MKAILEIVELKDDVVTVSGDCAVDCDDCYTVGDIIDAYYCLRDQ